RRDARGLQPRRGDDRGAAPGAPGRGRGGRGRRRGPQLGAGRGARGRARGAILLGSGQSETGHEGRTRSPRRRMFGTRGSAPDRRDTPRPARPTPPALDMTELDAMRRALDLAWRGWGRVHPNPLVGAVVLSGSAIIGEGYHAEFGGPHAEREA